MSAAVIPLHQSPAQGQQEEEGTKLPQFIADQRILRLNLTEAQRANTREYLTTANLPDPDQSLADPEDQDRLRYNRYWQRVRNRLQYLTTAGPVRQTATGQRLCVTTLAGIGKSKLLNQLAVVRAHLAHAQLVLSGEELEFARLPEHVDEYLSRPFGEKSVAPFLVEHVRRRLQRDNAGLARLPSDFELQRWLIAQARNGRLTLVIDGLDEIPVVEGKDRARELAEFLKRFPRVHCVVAGRPYAIYNDYWAILFARSSESPASDWEFCQTEIFTEAQRERFLGATRLRQLRQYRGRMELSGRTLEVLRTLTEKKLDAIRSIADVYWYSIEKSVYMDSRKSADKPPQTELTGDQALAILSAFAILTVQGWSAPESCNAAEELNLEPLPQAAEDSTAKDLRRSVPLTDAFLDHLDQLIARALKLKTSAGPDTTRARQLYDELIRLSPAYVEFSYVTLQGNQGRWRDATCRDFFAALWLLRYSNKEERVWMTQRPTWIRTDWQGKFIRGLHSELYEVWQMLCGMPPEAYTDFDEKGELWSAVIGSLFLPRQTSEPRPTELMVRAWPTLLSRAGFLQKTNWDDADLQTATVTVQKAVKTSHQSRTWPEFSGSESCQRILRTFLLQYLYLRDGSATVGNAETATICHEDLESQFRNCESFAGKTFYAGDGKSYGSGPATLMTLDAAFTLCAVPVTRRLYALFDTHHAGQFRTKNKNKNEDYDRYSPDPRCPAIYLSYWDSVMFSIWSHSRLPTEWEWEYAARAGKDQPGKAQPIWWWGNDESQLVKYAWIRRNSEGTTHPVGDLEANPDPYKLYDMLGNVLEWTSSLFRPGDPSSVSRVVRGGSFRSDAVLARCSRRSGSVPSVSDHDTGCRVARADF
jgi:formylglycine-generating enzyme required for sulfatase activity